jgi:hypothetical protein
VFAPGTVGRVSLRSTRGLWSIRPRGGPRLRLPIARGNRLCVSVICRSDDSRLKNVKRKTKCLRVEIEVAGHRRVVAALAFWPVDVLHLRCLDAVAGLAEIVTVRKTGPEVAAIRERRVADKSWLTAKAQAGVRCQRGRAPSRDGRT